MMVDSLLRPILDNDALTRGLGDPEARVLVEWLVEQVEFLARGSGTEDSARRRVDGLCRRARCIGRFVALWAQPHSQGAACQLAATERFRWPLPTPDVDPCDLMQHILRHEGQIS